MTHMPLCLLFVHNEVSNADNSGTVSPRITKCIVGVYAKIVYNRTKHYIICYFRSEVIVLRAPETYLQYTLSRISWH